MYQGERKREKIKQWRSEYVRENSKRTVKRRKNEKKLRKKESVGGTKREKVKIKEEKMAWDQKRRLR